MTSRPRTRREEEGYLLLWLVVVCFLLLLALGVAAPTAARQLERDREVEAEHRAQEYVRAIQLYYRRTGTYPASIEQLLGTGTTGGPATLQVKYLRQQYKDPLTRGDFRLIHQGEAKTEVKGFFGEPLPGLTSGGGLGSLNGSQPGQNGGSALGGGSPFGSTTGTVAGGGAAGSTSPTGSAGTSTTAGTTTNSATGASGSSPASGAGTTGAAAGTGATPFGGTGTSATSFQGSKGAIVGIGSNAKGEGLVEWNGSHNIEDWEFLYDPRVEALRAKVSLFGGGPPTVGSSNALGSGTIGPGSLNNNAPAGTFGAAPGVSTPGGGSQIPPNPNGTTGGTSIP